jgi:hypothetical protein
VCQEKQFCPTHFFLKANLLSEEKTISLSAVVLVGASLCHSNYKFLHTQREALNSKCKKKKKKEKERKKKAK